MVKITWSNLALESIHAASEFHRPYSARFADAFIERVFEKVFLLESHPLMGRIVPEFNRPDLRELLYKTTIQAVPNYVSGTRPRRTGYFGGASRSQAGFTGIVIWVSQTISGFTQLKN